jgi:hypothetical protein
MTRRQEIIKLLSVEAPTLRELADMLPADPQDLLDDLAHIARSIRPQGKLVVTPAQCRKCGFTFRDTGKFKTPSRCPKCKSAWLQAPTFHIQRKAN